MSCRPAPLLSSRKPLVAAELSMRAPSLPPLQYAFQTHLRQIKSPRHRLQSRQRSESAPPSRTRRQSHRSAPSHPPKRLLLHHQAALPPNRASLLQLVSREHRLAARKRQALPPQLLPLHPSHQTRCQTLHSGAAPLERQSLPSAPII